MRLRTRILAPFAAAMLLLAGIVAFGLQRLGDELLRENLDAEVRMGQQAIKATTDVYDAHIEELVHGITANREFVAAMRDGDRERLYALARPYLEDWQAHSRITHFYFHTPAGINLLRVHLKDNHGDRIGRHSMRIAMASGKTGMATEIGLTGEWVRRVVVPWRVDGALIGYVELGVDMERVYAAAARHAATTVLVLLKKSAIQSPAIWEKRRLQLGLSPYGWDTLPGHVVVIHRGRPLDPAALKALPLDGGAAQVARARGLLTHVQALRDEGTGATVGAEVQLLDTSSIQDRVERDIERMVAAVLLLLALVVAALHGFLGRIQRQLDT